MGRARPPGAWNLVLLGWVATVRGYIGYAASFESPEQAAGLQAAYLDPVANAELAKLSAGFTVMSWVQYRDLSPYRTQCEFTMITSSDDNFFNGFGGLGGSFMLGSGSEFARSSAPADHDHGSWNHYAVSYDATSGQRRYFINSAVVKEDVRSYTHASDYMSQRLILLLGIGRPWRQALPSHPGRLAHAPASVAWCARSARTGQQCYHSKFSSSDPVDCNLLFSPNVRLDDFAVFHGALSSSEVAERWDQSLTARLAAGLEPKLVIFVRALATHLPRLAENYHPATPPHPTPPSTITRPPHSPPCCRGPHAHAQYNFNPCTCTV